jgi:hypothetical protein
MDTLLYHVESAFWQLRQAPGHAPEARLVLPNNYSRDGDKTQPQRQDVA